MKCVKCGKRLAPDGERTKKLWCDHCRYYVDKEIRGESCRSFRFYFQYRIKCKQERKHTND